MEAEEFEELLLKIANAISELNDRITALEAHPGGRGLLPVRSSPHGLISG